MSTTEELLGQFIEAWNAGERPDLRDYLDRAPRRERDRLADLVGVWLELAPTPAYSPEALAAIAREPALAGSLDALDAEPAELGGRVAVLRERAGLALAEVARRVTALFELDDEPRTAGYLERLERGELDDARLSRRLLAGLAAVLGARADELVPRPAPAAGQTFFRAGEESGEALASGIDALSRAALAPAPSGGQMDELDRLFLGGPEG
jgi:transcriptional regulator with XRE-family HTH domain